MTHLKIKTKVLFIAALSLVFGSAFLSSHETSIFVSKPVVVEAGSLDSYYSGVNGNGSSLLLSVRSAITSGYHSLGYDGLWNAYKSTDVTSNGKLRDLYSDNTNFTLGSKQCGSYSKAGDCYNREHTIPQSWWGGGTSNQGCDIHIVWPSDGYINNIRDNYPFGECKNGIRYAMAGDPEGNRRGSSTSTQYVTGGVFEPFDSRKGDMARSYFYAVARWSEAPTWTSAEGSKVFSSSGNNGFVQKYLDMLLKWHKLDPVDEFEISRNNAAQSKQGNRNPFVDHPSWVDLIWGGTYTGLNEENTKQGTVVNGRLDGGSTTVHLSSILIEGQTDSYMVGDTFTFDGKCYALYSSGITREVTPTIVNMPDMSLEGPQTVTFSYTDVETQTFDLEIYVGEKPPVVPVDIILLNAKTEYYVGDTFVMPTVKARLSDGTYEIVTEQATHSDVDLSTPCEELLVTIFYTYEEETFSKGYTITVIARPDPEIVRIKCVSPKVLYNIFDEFEAPRVLAVYDNEFEEELTEGVAFSGYNMDEAGIYTVIATYLTFTANYTITVVDNRPTLSSIELSNIKSTYEIGEEFVKPTVTAIYSDDSTKDVTNDATFSGFNSQQEGRITIEVSYVERGVTRNATFYVKINGIAPSGGCSGNVLTTSMILSALSLLAIGLLLIKKVH